MSFNSNENKGLLWGLMYEGGVFTNIPQSNLSKVKELFENKINNLNRESGSILEKNKRAMVEMVKELESLRTKPALSQNMHVQERNYDTPVTASDIQAQRQEAFNNNLEKKQQDFNSMMAVKKPKEMDFSDSPDEKPIGSEMDKLLADMIARRDLQLTNASASHNATAAQEWITKDNSNPDAFTNTITSSSNGLKIGEPLGGELPNVENIRMDVTEEISKKRVTFKEEPSKDEGLSFFERFKKTERDNSEIISEIKLLRGEITERLSKIDALLVELT